MAKNKLFAAIDVGSLGLCMKIVEVSDRVRVIENVSHVIALGTNTYLEGKISFELVEECCAVLKGFVKIMKEYNVTAYKAYATSAIREAENRDYITSQIELETSLKVEILDNAVERFLHTKAVAAKYPQFDLMVKEGALIVDIGAGSVQVSSYEGGKLYFTRNLRLGSLRVKEVLGDIEKQTLSFKDILEEYIEVKISSAATFMDFQRFCKSFIGVGGCAHYLCRLCNIENRIIKKENFDLAYNILLKSKTDEIEKRCECDFETAALLLPSAMVYKKFMELSGADSMYVPNVSLSDGMIAEFAPKFALKNIKHDFEEDIYHSVRILSKKFKYNKTHAVNIEKISEAIFNGLQKRYKLTRHELMLLKIASIIHEIGCYVNINLNRYLSGEIILASELLGLSELDRYIIAKTLRFFDDERVNGSHETRVTIARLCAILKVADGLDCVKTGKFCSLKASIKGRDIIINISGEQDLTLEKWELSKSADFFMQVYGLKPIIKNTR